MNFRWLWLTQVPHGIMLTKAERQSVTSLARKLRRERPIYRMSRQALVVYTIVIPWLTFAAIACLLNEFVVVGPLVYSLLAVALAAGVVCAIRRYQSTYVWRALCVIGHDTCVNCGYALVGLGEDVKECPECGENPSDDCPHCGGWLGDADPASKTCPHCEKETPIEKFVWADIRALRELGYAICRNCGRSTGDPDWNAKNCARCDRLRAPSDLPAKTDEGRS